MQGVTKQYTSLVVQTPVFLVFRACCRLYRCSLPLLSAFSNDRLSMTSDIDEVDAPRRHRCAQVGGVSTATRRGGVRYGNYHIFQAHGADASGIVLLRKRLRRNRVLEFFARQPMCIVAMEACSSAHYWAREIGKFGHTVRLIPPQYVKPFVKRQKNDEADAEAICEAAQRPTMRFVAVKSEEPGQRGCVSFQRFACASAHANDQCSARSSGGVRTDRGSRSLSRRQAHRHAEGA
jgi:hypothetical protein